MSLSKDRWQTVSPYLDAAMDLEGDARVTWFATLRESHPDIAADLQSLLAQGELLRQEGFLEDRTVFLPDPTLAGQTLGSYTLVSLIGRGGMGSVWLGRRSDGRFEGLVAIKLLDTSLIGRAGEERFAREGTFLARLTHPHIARLIDAGVSPTGQPYLVLERIEGEQIDRYCDQQGLGIETRLRLFLDVLAAVSHAHANLIVHRDIKPSNVLVSTRGEVKLLDFGIATLLQDGSLARDATVLTREGGRALTPEYAAPEQMLGEPITTATDVYSLGVLLYVLLTGRHPVSTDATSPAQLVKAIVDTVPTRASDTVATVNGSPDEPRAEMARRRASTPDKLQKLLRGDLDNIVGKALKKNPQERYASVTAFADDLRRYLHHEPISARPDALSYRTRKFVRRHARAVATAAAIVIVLTSLIAFYTTRLAAERDKAQLEAQKSAQVSQLLTGLLTGADPYATRQTRETTVRDVLDAGADHVHRELAGQSEVQAQMLTVIGRVYQRLGAHDRAQPLLEEALEVGRRTLGPEHEQVAQSMNDLAVVLRQRGEFAAATAMSEQALAMRRRLLGNEHSDVAITLVELGRTYVDHGAPERAEPLFREALATRRKLFGDEHRETATSQSDLALLLWQRGDTAAAEPLFRQVLATSRKILGQDHPEVATALNNLGLISMEKREFAAAESMFRETIAVRTRGMGGKIQGSNAVTLNNLAAALREQGKNDEAAAALEEALQTSMPALGDDHPTVAILTLHLARVHVARNDGAAAEPLARRGLVIRERALSKGDWRIAAAKSVLGAALSARGRYTDAEALLLEAHAELKDVPGPQGRDAKANKARLVTLYDAWGRPEKAAAYRKEE